MLSGCIPSAAENAALHKHSALYHQYLNKARTDRTMAFVPRQNFNGGAEQWGVLASLASSTWKNSSKGYSSQFSWPEPGRVMSWYGWYEDRALMNPQYIYLDPSIGRLVLFTKYGVTYYGQIESDGSVAFYNEFKSPPRLYQRFSLENRVLTVSAPGWELTFEPTTWHKLNEEFEAKKALARQEEAERSARRDAMLRGAMSVMAEATKVAQSESALAQSRLAATLAEATRQPVAQGQNHNGVSAGSLAAPVIASQYSSNSGVSRPPVTATPTVANQGTTQNQANSSPGAGAADARQSPNQAAGSGQQPLPIPPPAARDYGPAKAWCRQRSADVFECHGPLQSIIGMGAVDFGTDRLNHALKLAGCPGGGGSTPAVGGGAASFDCGRRLKVGEFWMPRYDPWRSGEMPVKVRPESCNIAEQGTDVRCY